MAETYCATIVPGLCSVVFSCCDAGEQAMYGTEAGCVADEMAVCLSWYAGLDASEAAGRIALDAGQLDACGAVLAALAISCDASLGGVLLLDCLSAVVGQLPTGAACAKPVYGFDWLECASGRCALGLCEPWPVAGSDCSTVGALCDVNEHRCIDDGTVLTCQVALPDGAACMQDVDCASIYCAPPPNGCMPFAGQDVCRDTG